MTPAAWILLTAAAVAAVVNWVAVAGQRRRVEYVAKPATMLLLVALAVALDPADPARRTWFVAAGIFCVAGDVFLMLPRDRFVPGLVSFLVGHVCYSAGFLAGGGLVPIGATAGLVVVAAAVLTVGRPVLAAVARAHHDLLAPVAVYLVVISAMVVLAFAAGPWPATAGALLFFGSDSLIAWQRFVRPRARAPVAIMVSYHLGQVGLMGSLVLPA